MDIFSELNKQLKENKSRWEKIDNLIDTIKSTSEPDLKDIVNLISLIADQIRPAKNAASQINDMQKDINDLLSNLKK